MKNDATQKNKKLCHKYYLPSLILCVCHIMGFAKYKITEQDNALDK